MNLKDWYHVPIIIAISLISISLFIGELGINNSDVSSFLSASDDLVTQAQSMKDAMDEKTSPSGLEAMIENVPVLNEVVKASKFVTGIANTIRATMNVFLGFMSDAMSSRVLGIPSSIIALLLIAGLGSYGFAILRSIRGGGDER